MRRLVIRNQELEIRVAKTRLFPNSYLLVSNICGTAVYNPSISSGQFTNSMHNAVRRTINSEHKPSRNTQTFTQPHLFLYTVYKQLYTTFVSVNTSVVHTFHSAYINLTRAK